jgi:hypothetical protein
MIVLGCLLSNMLFKQGNVLRTPRVNIDGGYDKEETKLQDIRKQLDQIGFHSIGIEKYVHQILIIQTYAMDFYSTIQLLVQ